MKCLRYVIVLCLWNIITIIHAQNNSTGNWISYFGNQPIGKKFTLWNEIQYRDYRLLGDFNQLIIRAGIGYNLTENNNNLLAGYAYVITDTKPDDAENIINENRLWQQFLNRQVINRVILQQRYRTEQRFFNDQYQFRFRYMNNIIVPINRKKLEKNTIYTHLFNEVFIKTNSPKFDRNRAYAGIGYAISPTKRIEIGFLNQTLEQSYRNQIQIYFFNNSRLF